MTVSYELRYRPEGGDAAWSDWINVGTATSHRLTGLSAGTEYDVEVRSRRNDVPSPALSGRRWTLFPAPSAPSVSNVRPQAATLTWTAVAGAKGYRVLRNGVAVGDVAGDVVTTEVSGLADDTPYVFSIEVLNPNQVPSAATAAPSVTTPPIATGGTVTTFTDGGTTYRVHTFTTTGNSSFTLNADRNVDYLIVAGGGGGGSDNAGGGGGGGVITGSTALAAGALTVTVGVGGAASGTTNVNLQTNGGNSSFNGLVAFGGGQGGNGQPGARARTVGGSGGGGHGERFAEDGAPTATGAEGTVGQGSKGGNGNRSSTTNFGEGGGGGGAGAAGGNATSGVPGNGGIGLASSITGTNYRYGSGGGGGTERSTVESRRSGASGTRSGGGGGGALGNVNGGNGENGFGGGGGGSATTAFSGGAGGSGVVILRYAV